MEINYSEIHEDISEKIIDKYFTDNPKNLVAHHLDSYNDFFNNGIQQIMREKNPIEILKSQDAKTNKFHKRCKIYLGGKDGNQLYFGKPIIYDTNREHFMYPNEARLRNMTYGITIHYDVYVEYYIAEENSEGNIVVPREPTATTNLEKIFLGRFPIMLQSNLCILKEFERLARFELGECKNDNGGYFIIDGKEKCIISQEKFADNILYIRDKVNELYSHSTEIRSVSEDSSKPVRKMSINMVAPNTINSNKHIVVNIPNVRKPIPLFILMRALGIQSDKDIIKHCLLDINKYSSYIDLFIPSIHDANKIFNQSVALKFISTFTKGKTIPHVLEILSDYYLPHIGEMNFKDKAYFTGYMVMQLLRVYNKEIKPTDRDNFRFKRVELPGTLIYDLFREYYSLQLKNIFQKIDKEYYYKKGIYNANFISLIETNYKHFFSERIVEGGFKKGFKGNWGSEQHTKKLGLVQDLNRLSYNSAISHLRKINLPLDASAKVVGPRHLHASQWGIIDPVDTPDGGNVGLHKHMALSAKITNGYSSGLIIDLLKNNYNIQLLIETQPDTLTDKSKIFINGNWIGTTNDPINLTKSLRTLRRTAQIPIYTSIYWDIKDNVIFIFTDAGRLCRPIYYINDERQISYYNKEIINNISNNNFNWEGLLSGFSKKKDPDFSINHNKIYKSNELYDKQSPQSIIEYIDTAEQSGALIAVNPNDTLKNKNYTHVEILPSLILGVMGNQVIFPENNPLPRDLFACGQMKQAVSLYHSNYLNRIDKMGVVLNNGQIPLVKSRYLEKINNEEHPYGENVIVAIMCYSGYNVEDSILFNKGSLKRGLFGTTYYNSYETYEESSKVGNSQIDSKFANIENMNVTNLKPGYDYSNLDNHGLVKENTLIDDKKVIIGKVTNNLENPDSYIDSSVFPKKGQQGYIDKAFITEGEEGFRLAKIRVRDLRTPAIGDKFCSRCGQKGTVGYIIDEEDMPFTEGGIRPDIIINPHALPSRMTIGQLVEMLMGKTCALYGGFGDCTAFKNKGQKATLFGDMLSHLGYENRGEELLYSGFTGEQLSAKIFMGPTYYMRLKHMVKDKINYRARGPRTVLTRQTVQGRANEGGLRIGEMERDGVIAHGATNFLQESMLTRGDNYYMAVCNNSGMLAIYNPDKNIFYSPYVDGPIKFSETLDDNMNVEHVSKFGRSFSVLRVPYAFKLLIQELQTMNIQMRLITEDNIEQLQNMSFSKNIDNLLGKKKEMSSIIKDNKQFTTNLKSTQLFKHNPTYNKETFQYDDTISDPIEDKKEQYESGNESGNESDYESDYEKDNIFKSGLDYIQPETDEKIQSQPLIKQNMDTKTLEQSSVEQSSVEQSNQEQLVPSSPQVQGVPSSPQVQGVASSLQVQGVPSSLQVQGVPSSPQVQPIIIQNQPVIQNSSNAPEYMPSSPAYAYTPDSPQIRDEKDDDEKEDKEKEDKEKDDATLIYNFVTDVKNSEEKSLLENIDSVGEKEKEEDTSASKKSVTIN